ncbi:MAG: hypothetical protein U0V64_14615 [Cyclobacteriaceae bacterium]
MNSAQNTMTLRQATLLALTVLCVYYPITIYFTLPTELWRNLPFLIFPALVNFVFYVLLILAIDRIIDRSEKWFGPRILQISFATIALSMVVAAVAVLLSILIFRTNIKFWSTLTDLFGTPPGNNKPPQFMWWTTLRRVNYGLTILMSISIYYLILNRKSQQRMADMEMQAAQLRKENAVAQFEALKNQVSPHFLFNSLQHPVIAGARRRQPLRTVHQPALQSLPLHPRTERPRAVSSRRNSTSSTPTPSSSRSALKTSSTCRCPSPTATPAATASRRSRCSC